MERFVAVSTEKVVEAAAHKLGTLEPKPSKELIKQKDDPGYEANVELILRGVLTRILFAKNFKELGEALSQAAAKVGTGTMEPGQLDQVRASVIDVATQMGGVEDQKVVQEVEGLFKLGDYVGAAKRLKDTAKKPNSGLLLPTELTIITDFLDKIKDKAHMSDVELDELAQTYVNEILKPHGELLADVATRNTNLEQLMLHEEIRILEEKKDVILVPADMKVVISTNKKATITAEVTPATAIEVKDREFILGLVGKAERFGARENKTRSSGRGAAPIVEREWNFERMYAKDVKLIWLRTSGILSKYETELATPGLADSKELLVKLRDGARQAMLNANEEALRGSTEDGEAERGTPRNRAMRRGRMPPQQELDFFADKRYTLNEDGAMGYESLLRKQVDDLREAGYGNPVEEVGGRTAQALEMLRAQRPELRRLLRFEEGKWKWFGTSREYFDLCREQIYDIQGSLTQENMGNLVFEESAQTYLALMRVDVGKKMELENAKDAITKMLYIDYAVRNMWKSGASVETWQRVASILTRDREEGFFEIMNIGENLRVTDADGNVIDLGRFTADDIMSLMEMKVEKANGKSRYWKTELASQSSALKTKRLPDYAKAIALRVIEKRELMELAGQKGGLNKVDADAERLKLNNGEYKFDEKQMRWMLRYGQFLGGATLRDGEYGINEALDGKKMEMADHPLGEFAIKTGPWAVIYYYHYEVTKYGGDAVGNLFLPNVSMLSYARGETVGHFIKKDSKVEAGMMKPSGEYQETGIGANEFFFSAGHIEDADNFSKFWGDVIFDTRTGNIAKTAVHRTVDVIREKGRTKLSQWDGDGKTGFIEHMNFGNMELMLGNSMGINNFKIPGNNNREKFEWMVDHFDYTFWRKDVMKAKREGDWVNKYVAKKYVETYTLLADFLNAPGLATKVKVRDKIGEYAGGPGMEDWEQKSQDFIDKNNEWHLLGWKTAPGSSSEAVWKEEGAGDFYTVEKQQHYAFEGGLGVPLAHSIQDAKEGFKNPMHFEKQDIDNNFYNGLISRKEWGKQRRKWYAKAYLGDEYKIAGLKIRPGYIPFLTPFFLARGWWVDKMGLDWDDFKLVFSKNNEETWEKFKKLIKT